MRETGSGVKAAGTGEILPGVAGGLALPADPMIEIAGQDESGLWACFYPGGFLRHHEAADAEELAQKLKAQLRARYGIEPVQFSGLPARLKGGIRISIKVQNGK